MGACAQSHHGRACERGGAGTPVSPEPLESRCSWGRRPWKKRAASRRVSLSDVGRGVGCQRPPCVLGGSLLQCRLSQASCLTYRLPEPRIGHCIPIFQPKKLRLGKFT